MVAANTCPCMWLRAPVAGPCAHLCPGPAMAEDVRQLRAVAPVSPLAVLRGGKPPSGLFIHSFPN